MAGAPRIPTQLLSDVRLAIGTQWHELIGETLSTAGEPIMREVSLTPWLPEGWGGTADFLQWNPDYEAFVLWDLKTIKGDAIRWIDRDGAKEGHCWQTSAYWYAAREAGFPMVETFGIYYFPISDSRDTYDVSPRLLELKPIPEIELMMRMNYVKRRVDEYLEALAYRAEPYREYLNDALEPSQGREQKIYWNKSAGVFDVKLVPHWTAAFCPFPDELCDCNTAGTTKIGHYIVSRKTPQYIPRKEYESLEPTIEPDEAEIRKRYRKAA